GHSRPYGPADVMNPPRRGRGAAHLDDLRIDLFRSRSETAIGVLAKNILALVWAQTPCPLQNVEHHIRYWQIQRRLGFGSLFWDRNGATFDFLPFQVTDFPHPAARQKQQLDHP